MSLYKLSLGSREQMQSQDEQMQSQKTERIEQSLKKHQMNIKIKPTQKSREIFFVDD